MKAEVIKKGTAHLHGVSLETCIEKYLKTWKDEAQDGTLNHHRLALGALQTYCGGRSVVYMKDLTTDLLEEFKNSLKGKPSTRNQYVNKIRCFLREAFRREWITRPLAETMKSISFSKEPKKPYTDDEVDRIFAQVGSMKPNRGAGFGYATYPATFGLLLRLILETGMRVGDAVNFDPKCLTRGKLIWVYNFEPDKQQQNKTKKRLDAYISDDLKTAIDGAQWMSSHLPFSYQGGEPTNLVRERMRTIGKRAKVEDCRPHRRRDTFAVRKLIAGVAIWDVSRLLGHSSVKVTETDYIHWVPGLADRLESVVAGVNSNPQTT